NQWHPPTSDHVLSSRTAASGGAKRMPVARSVQQMGREGLIPALRRSVQRRPTAGRRETCWNARQALARLQACRRETGRRDKAGETVRSERYTGTACHRFECLADRPSYSLPVLPSSRARVIVEWCGVRAVFPSVDTEKLCRKHHNLRCHSEP